MSYYNIVDKVANMLIADKFCNQTGVSSSVGKISYGRYLKTNDGRFALGIWFDWATWQSDKKSSSPFWMSIQPILDKGEWGASAHFKQPLEAEGYVYSEWLVKGKKIAYTPLCAAAGVGEYELVKNIAGQVKRILSVL